MWQRKHKKSSSSSSAPSSCNRLETCSNHPTSPAEPQVAGSTQLKSGRYRHHDLHRQRDVHLSLQSKWPSATLPQASKEHIQDQSGPTLTKCDRSVLPVWCTSALRHVGLDQAVKLTIYMMLAGIQLTGSHAFWIFLGQCRLHLLYGEVVGLPSPESSLTTTRCLDGQLFRKKLATLLLWFPMASRC